MSAPDRLPRSLLYVPGNASEKLAKAGGRGADALIVDLEDAVPASQKEAASEAVRGWLAGGGAPGVQVWVRVNAGPLREADVQAFVGNPHVHGLVLAKTESAAEVAAIADLLGAAGDERLLLMPLLETPRAVQEVELIAAVRRVHRFQVGEVDLAAELGMTPGDDELELLAIRTRVVLASAAAGLHPPVGPVSRDIDDRDRLAASTRRLARLGYLGRACIHPGQVPVVHEVFTPTDDRLAQASEVVRLMARAQDEGLGVAVDADGRFLDAAVLREAQRVLAMRDPGTGAG